MKITAFVFLMIFCTGLVYGFSTQIYSDSHINPEQVRARWEKCTRLDDSGYVSCMRKMFTEFLRPQNLKLLLTIVEKNGFSPRQNRSSACHEVAHIIGEVVVSSGAPIPDLIRKCGSSCGYGCVHGVMVGAQRRDHDIFTTPDKACSPVSGDPYARTDQIACRHGIGHAYMEFYSNDRTVAVLMCNQFKDEVAKEECATGVYMQWFMNAPSLKGIPTKDRLNTFCQGVPQFAYQICKRSYAGEVYRYTNDVLAALDICKSLGNDEDEKCIVALGSEIFFQKNSSIPEIISECLKTDVSLMTCLTGAIISSFEQDTTGKIGEEICQKMPAQYGAECNANFTKVQTSMSSHN